MKKIIFLIILLPVFAAAQQLPDFGTDRVRIADANGTIQAELLPVSKGPDKKLNLFYYWYSANMIHATQGSYSGKLLNGNYNSYYPNKNLKEQGIFKKGLKDGTWRNWNENGTLLQVVNWKSGFRTGKFEAFDTQGKLLQTGKYKHDSLVRKDSSSFWKKINILKKKNKPATKSNA